MCLCLHVSAQDLVIADCLSLRLRLCLHDVPVNAYSLQAACYFNCSLFISLLQVLQVCHTLYIRVSVSVRARLGSERHTHSGIHKRSQKQEEKGSRGSSSSKERPVSALWGKEGARDESREKGEPF